MNIVTVEKWVVMFWSFRDGFKSKVVGSEQEAQSFSGYGDFAGISQVDCRVPEEANDK